MKKKTKMDRVGLAFRKHMTNTSLNQVKKDLGLGSHNTVKRWLDAGLPAGRRDQVAKYLGL